MSDYRNRILAALLNDPSSLQGQPMSRLSDVLNQPAPDRNALPNLGNPQQSSAPAWLRNLDISGNVGQSGSQYDKTVYGDGRIGYNVPINNNNLNFGVSGSGYRSKGEDGTQSGFGVNGADATLETGSGSYSASYDRLNKMLQLMYRNRF